MLYHAYQVQSDVMGPVRVWAGRALQAIGSGPSGIAGNGVVRNLTAAYELIARAGLTHDRPAFGIDRVTVGNREVAVRERAVLATPFGTLLHFGKDANLVQPRVLLVAPLSGHFSTLLRGTVRTMLPEHDVYITDWHNVRDVAPAHGRFGLDEYIEQVIRFLEAIGPGAHVLAVCQPCVQVLAAAALTWVVGAGFSAPAWAQGAVKSVHNDWQVRCDTPPGAQGEQCALIQSVTAEDRANVGLTVIVLKTADQKSRLMRVVAPVGVLLPSGLGLKIDQVDVGRAGFVRCLPNGCVAEVVMDDNLVKQLRTGQTATFIIFQTPEEGIGFPMSLKGFGEGYDKLP